MDALDRYLNRIAYKFDKGYPDVNDPKDMEMLFGVINEIMEQQLSLFFVGERGGGTL